MSYFPSRCQHIKVNGTQCGSPALRTCKLCFFHQRSEDERAQFAADRARKTASALDLPLLEDANSIQLSLSQIMHRIVTGQIEIKTAGVLIYLLQTASGNLRRVNFSPYMHSVVVDPSTVDQTLLNGDVWKNSDFITDEQYARAERANAVAIAEREAARRAEKLRWAEAEGHRIMLEGDRERAAERTAEKEKKARAAAAAAAAPPSAPPVFAATVPVAPTPAPEIPAAKPSAPATSPTPAAMPVVTAPAAPLPPAIKPAVAVTAPPRPSPATRPPASEKPPAQKSSRNSVPRNSVVMTSLSLNSADDPPPPAPASPQPPKRFPPVATADEVRRSLREQIRNALPEVAAAFAEKRNGNSG